jgi:hypothetical protein
MGMKRDIEKLLLEWKEHPLRMPLLIRGQLTEQFIGQELLAYTSMLT